MSRKCAISGKGSLKGHNVSHSRVRTRKLSYANLQSKRLFDSTSKKWITVKVSARMLRTIDKKGLDAAIRESGKKLSDFAV